MVLQKWAGKIAAKKVAKRVAHLIVAILASKGISESLGIAIDETVLAAAIYGGFIFAGNWLKHKVPKLGAIL